MNYDLNQTAQAHSMTVDEYLRSDEFQQDDNGTFEAHTPVTPVQPLYVQANQPLVLSNNHILLDPDKIEPTEPKMESAFIQQETPVVTTPQVNSTSEIDLNQLANELPKIVTLPETPKPVEVPQSVPVSETPEVVKTNSETTETKETALNKVRNIIREIAPKQLRHWKISGFSDKNYKVNSVLIDFNVLSNPLTNERKVDIHNPTEYTKLMDCLLLPTDTNDNMINFVEKNPMSVDGDENEMELKASIMTEGIQLGNGYGEFIKATLKNPDTGMNQYIYHDQMKEMLRHYPTTTRKQDGMLTGFKAKVAITDALGLSSHTTVVLPHSGIVAVIASPVLSDLVDMQNMIDTNKIEYGKWYGGATYGTASWFIVSKMVDLFISKIKQVNVKDSSRENLLSLISPLDIPTIAMTLSASRFPNGYNYARSVMTKEGNIEIVSGTINLFDTAFFMNSRISTRQKQHLLQSNDRQFNNEEFTNYRNNWVTQDQVKPYRFLVREHEVVEPTKTGALKTYKKQVFFTLHESNLTDMFESGASWDEQLKESINRVIGDDASGPIKKKYLSSKITASQLRDYSHMIKSIDTVVTCLEDNEVNETTTSDISVILESIDVLAQEPDLVIKVREEIVKFIDDNTKVVYGVPVAIETETTSPNSKAIVSLNPVNLFFTMNAMTYQKLEI